MVWRVKRRFDGYDCNAIILVLYIISNKLLTSSHIDISQEYDLHPRHLHYECVGIS